MKKIVSIFLALFLVSCGSYQSASDSTTTGKSGSVSETGRQKVTAQSILANMERGQYKEGELLVKFKTGAAHKSVGASVLKQFPLMPEVELVKLHEGVSVSDAVVQYMSDPNVEYAEPNYMIHSYSATPPEQVFPNDTYFVNLWGLHNTGSYAYGFDDADIDAPEAWGLTTGSQNVRIAVVDTGIDYNHSDLVGNIWTNPGELLGDANNDGCPGVCGVDDDGDGLIDEVTVTGNPALDDDENGYPDDLHGYNFANNDNDPMDDYGHGTHVAGTIGAHGNNGQGLTGVMWRASLMPLKALDSNGSGTTADVSDAITYAVAEGAKVINASWGGLGYSQTLYDAISAANSAGVLFVAAAGNGFDDGVGDNNDIMPAYPASFDLPNIIAVAATDQRDALVSFSNYGPISVDVAAPGVYTWSTVPNWWSIFPGYGIIETFSGTSMAAPHVTGVAGLLFSYYDGIQNTGFTHSQVRGTIIRYVDWLSSLNGSVASNGRINAYKAVSSLLMPTGLTATAQSAGNETEFYSPSINLSWTDNSTGEDGFDIERKSSGGFTKVAFVGADSTTYNDPNLDPSTTYTYRVSATNNIAASMPSNEATETTLPGSGKVKGNGGGCSITAGKDAGRVDLLVMLLPVAAILTLIKRRKS